MIDCDIHINCVRANQLTGLTGKQFLNNMGLQIVEYTLNKKSWNGQGKFMVTVLQKKFLVQ